MVRLQEEERRIFVVAEVHTKFHAPARLSDTLIVTAGLQGLTRVSFDIEQRIYRNSTDGDLLISGIVKAAYLDADSMRPKRVPPSLFGEYQS
jgi:acyl-CoA thioester hydrolase